MEAYYLQVLFVLKEFPLLHSTMNPIITGTCGSIPFK